MALVLQTLFGLQHQDQELLIHFQGRAVDLEKLVQDLLAFAEETVHMWRTTSTDRAGSGSGEDLRRGTVCPCGR